MEKSVAILLTCFNRKEKTLICLHSLYKARMPKNLVFDVFLVDDGSSDGTAEAVKEFDPDIHIIQGTGDLFWAGGMRLAYENANEYKDFDFFLLLNDDVELKKDFIVNIFESRQFGFEKKGKGGIYSSSTLDRTTDKISYGGHILSKSIDNPNYQLLLPTNVPQECHLTNANILLVEKEVIDKIGFFDLGFVHSFADYDFSLRALKAGFPVYITSGIGGYCVDDHGNSWSSSKKLKDRIQYMHSSRGLAYKEYLFYIKRHFPKHSSRAFVKLWAKSFFPFIWDIKSKLQKG